MDVVAGRRCSSAVLPQCTSFPTDAMARESAITCLDVVCVGLQRACRLAFRCGLQCTGVMHVHDSCPGMEVGDTLNQCHRTSIAMKDTTSAHAYVMHSTCNMQTLSLRACYTVQYIPCSTTVLEIMQLCRTYG